MYLLGDEGYKYIHNLIKQMKLRLITVNNTSFETKIAHRQIWKSVFVLLHLLFLNEFPLFIL
jgi:hypothetical protein